MARAHVRTGLAAAITGVVPPGARVAVRLTRPSVLPCIAASERDVVAAAVPSRQEDFAAGRWCAHRALAALGADVPVLGRGERGEPLWPSGVTGSISHTDGVAAAIVAPAAAGSLGLDIEVARALSADLWTHVLTPTERARCAGSIDPSVAAGRMFSIKEAAFKALYPVIRHEVDYLDAVVSDDLESVLVTPPGLTVSVSVRSTLSGRLVIAVGVVDPSARRLATM